MGDGIRIGRALLRAQAQPRRVSKYNAKPTVIDGRRFASKKEAQHFVLLRAREAAGEISELVCQPRFPIKLNGVLICTYVADFSYVENVGGQRATIDCKGVRTREYIIKRKLMRAVHGVVIEEV